MDKVIFFTDGSCLGNPGPGGWAIIAKYNNYTKTVTGGEPDTTNNKMELKAAVEALKLLKRKVDEIELYSDSQYVVKGINEWLEGWKQRNFKNVKNPELWDEMDKLIHEKCKKIKAIWVKGHDGHLENEKVDDLARAEAYKHKR